MGLAIILDPNHFQLTAQSSHWQIYLYLLLISYMAFRTVFFIKDESPIDILHHLITIGVFLYLYFMQFIPIVFAWLYMQQVTGIIFHFNSAYSQRFSYKATLNLKRLNFLATIVFRVLLVSISGICYLITIIHHPIQQPLSTQIIILAAIAGNILLNFYWFYLNCVDYKTFKKNHHRQISG